MVQTQNRRKVDANLGTEIVRGLKLLFQEEGAQPRKTTFVLVGNEVETRRDFDLPIGKVVKIRGRSVKVGSPTWWGLVEKAGLDRRRRS